MICNTTGDRRILLAMVSGMALFGIWQGLRQVSDETEVIVPLLLMLAAAAWRCGNALKRETCRETRAWVAWLLLFAAFAMLSLGIFASDNLWKNMALLAACCGCGVFYGGFLSGARMLVPGILAFGVIPFCSVIMLFCSYPLRLTATDGTVAFFALLGMPVGSSNMVISAGTTRMVITDACSGITQLGVLALLAYMLLPAASGWRQRFCFAALVVPATVVANTIRLILTVGLFFMFGEVALGDTAHTLLGYFFVLLSCMLLWLCGKWVR